MHASQTAISKSTPEIVLKSVFNRYDIHGTGHLEFDAFALVLEDLGIVGAIEQQALFALADSSNKRTLHFTEFLNLIKSNDFEHILSNQEDYLFVIETYESFLEYDVDRDGQITWNEFYFYLHKHGYSHEYISTYWYYMDQNGTGSITFEQFWKGFKAQSEAHKVKILHQQINQQIILFDAIEDKKQPQISYKQADQNNIFRAIKKQLKPVKRKKKRSPFKSKVGRVMEESDVEDHESSISNVNYHDKLDTAYSYSDSDSSSLSAVMSTSDSESSSDSDSDPTLPILHKNCVSEPTQIKPKKTPNTKETQNEPTIEPKETKSVKKQTKKTSKKDKEKETPKPSQMVKKKPTKSTNIKEKKTTKATQRKETKSVNQTQKIDDKKTKKQTCDKPMKTTVNAKETHTKSTKIDEKKGKKQKQISAKETHSKSTKKGKETSDVSLHTKPKKSTANTKETHCKSTKIDDKKTKKGSSDVSAQTKPKKSTANAKETHSKPTKPQKNAKTKQKHTKSTGDKKESVTLKMESIAENKDQSFEMEQIKHQSQVKQNRKHRSQSAFTQKDAKKLDKKSDTKKKPQNDRKERQKQQRQNDIKIAKRRFSQRLSQRLSVTDLKQITKETKDSSLPKKKKKKTKKKKHKHAAEKSLNGFNLLKSLRIQSLQIGKDEKQKELKQKKKIKLKKKPTQIKRAVEMNHAPTSHIRQRSLAINSMASIIDLKPNQRSHKYIFKHLHEKNNKLIAADSSKWDRNWGKIYKQRVVIAALKERQREDKKKDLKTLLAEKRAKAEEVNRAFMDAHYRLPLYKADDSHWDGHDWDKINESREQIAALKRRKREDKGKDFKTLQRERQEKINEMNRAFINPHYKLNPLYAADQTRWDLDWDKIAHSRQEIAALKQKKREDKEKDFKTRQAEKKEKVNEVNQVFMDAHYKLPLYKADDSHWDRDWEKINRSREEINALKKRKKRDREKDFKTRQAEKKEKVNEVNQVFMDAHYKLPVYAANKGNWDLDWDKINKRRLEIKRLKQKRRDAKMNKLKPKTTDDIKPKKERERQHRKKDIQMAKKRLSKRLSLKLGTQSEDNLPPQLQPKMQTIHSEGWVLSTRKTTDDDKEIVKEIPQRRLSKRLSLKMGIEAATIVSLLPAAVIHSIVENEDGNTMTLELEPIEENTMNETFESECVMEQPHTEKEKERRENRRFRSRSAFTRKDAKKLVKKKLVKPSTMLSKEDNKKRINAARDNLEDFMIENGFWQIDFFLILVEFGINEPDDLGYISKKDKKQIIKLAKQKGLFSAKVKKFKAHLNSL
eukprot:28156_1